MPGHTGARRALDRCPGSSQSLREALAAAAGMLAESGCEEPRLDADVMLSHVLGLTTAQLYGHSERLLSADEHRRYWQMVHRRATHEPLAYITGRKAFYDLDLLVDRRVLIPRPETELLVSRAIEIATAQSTAGLRPVIADIGTGSGAIAICLARNLPEASIYAVDISVAALEVAAVNCQRYGVETRIRLLHGDLMQPIGEPVSLVVANLPYIMSRELGELPRSIRQFEPLVALDGGQTGLHQIERLLSQVTTKLSPCAAMVLEIGAHQGDAASALARRYFPDAEIHVLADLAGLDRLLTIHTP